MVSQIEHHCSSCGKINRDGARFCAHCGQSLTTASVPAEPFVEPHESSFAQAQPGSEVAPEQPAAVEKLHERTTEGEIDVTHLTEQEDDVTFISPTANEAIPAIETQTAVLEIGQFLASRYKIIDQIPASKTNPLTYLAHDLGKCPACAFEQAQLFEQGANYCPACGIQLNQPLECYLQLVETAVAPLTPNQRYINHEGLDYLVQSTPASAVMQPETPRYFRLRFGFQSDTGKVREVDEDSVLTLTMTTMFEGKCETTLGLFIVSDGIGGHQAGEVASRQTIQLIGARIISRIFQRSATTSKSLSEDKLTTTLREAVEAANLAIHEKQREINNDMGATVTAVLIYNQTAVIANVGDSRTYLWRNSELTAITQDHSLVASLIAAKQLPEEAIYTHEQKGAIYRSLGDKPEVQVDTFPLDLTAEDRLVLCCDGVWEMLRNEGIKEVLLSEPDPQRACDEIVKRANYAGGDDNISVIIIIVDPVY
jgi:serine/threonine protein phosphatase PrpC/uncharacterized Zn finger protein (UPF0148 family)